MMTKDQLLADIGLTEDELHTKITEVAVSMANVASKAGLHPAFGIDAALRFVASMIWSLAETAGNPQVAHDMVAMFKTGLDKYIEEIQSKRDIIVAGTNLPATTEYVA